MGLRWCVIALAFGLISGCHHAKVNAPAFTQVMAPHQRFVAQNFDWSSVQRIVLMPLANQTAYPRIGSELQSNLAAELQRAGRFDVVVATRDDPGVRSQDVFRSGEFNEIELLRVAREYQAQAVLFVNVTQYHPYVPPRLGVSLLLVSPSEGIVIASTDGLWDARETAISAQAQAHFKQTQSWPQSLIGSERVLESPDVFQRFVCEQIAVALYPPATGVSNTSVPFDATMTGLSEIPPVPPSSMSVP